VKKVTRVFHVREEALKLLYYLKASFIIYSQDESNFWNELFEYGYKKIEEVEQQGQKIYMGRIDHKRIPAGGYFYKELYDKLIELGERNKLKKYEIIELAIYFYAYDKLDIREKEFFELEKWDIVII